MICPAKCEGHKRRTQSRRMCAKAKRRRVVKDEVQEEILIVDEAHKDHIMKH